MTSDANTPDGPAEPSRDVPQPPHSGGERGREDEPHPRLAPRPTARPGVSEGEHAVFGRPSGVAGSFDGQAPSVPDERIGSADPDPVLREAFARPEGSTEVLQRDPFAIPPGTEREDEAPSDPWRDTESLAGLGDPAAEAPPRPEPGPGPKLGVREVLFGERVAPRALAALAGVALVIALVGALVGGFVGRITGTTYERLTDPHAALAQDSSKISDQGSAAAVVSQVGQGVVTIDVRTRTSGGLGSGSVIDASRGYILTNNHVVSDAVGNNDAKTEVVFWNGRRVPAKVVGADPGTDLAVVKVDVDGLHQIGLGDSDQLAPGQPVVAIGSPVGLERTVTTGVVSATHRAIQEPADGADAPAVLDAVQTDAAINHGNSGGPLLDMKGRLVGVNTLASNAEFAVGLNFAISINVAKPIIEKIIRGEKVVHADLGVNGRTVSNDTASGVRVENVKNGGAAARAGIREGDVITKVGDTDVADYAAVVVAIRAAGVGKQVPVTVTRGGRTTTVQVTPQADS
ncbi:trypsin-like peptidase domain-containing protein [Tsukamurella sp. 8F]|uniref:trypsin-like peptidase domain-containing protein n=1 Tax=unclassified Tsukamurella TaxID=2633480 RepID=UPI0023BA395E|nr:MULTISPECIES: trypsin-like peptidase domain-containing protein [unclassified Tsukamurella]MDF0529034.1 trypsin-like peptidase domain-containing protein [Tsukamurella sp. 8J]MDF0587407.1 trypsin-like peptidase domain-containing protein [Tsukamurella sp. 8F]